MRVLNLIESVKAEVSKTYDECKLVNREMRRYNRNHGLKRGLPLWFKNVFLKHLNA